MKVLWIRLRNFRGVADRTVRFQETGVTIVEGGNEVGKTSLFDGLDLLLEKQDSSRDAKVRGAVPTHVDAGPEVEAEIVAGEYRFTYRKRWHRNLETVLTLTTPRAESLTGREAHERVRRIIATSVDESLWKALRVTQTDPVEQANLQDAAALGRALDLAAGGDSGGADDHLDLYARVRAEYESYFTAKQGKPTGDYARAISHAAATSEDADRRAADLGDLDHSVAEHERLTGELTTLRQEQDRHQIRLTGLRERWRELETRQQLVDNLQQHARHTQLEAEQAGRDRDERQELIAQVADQGDILADLRTAHADDQSALDTARTRSDEADQARELLRTALRDAEVRYTQANSDVDHLHDRDELEKLTDRWSRATDAVDDSASAQAEIATIRIDEALLSALEETHDRLVRARAELDAASGTIRLEALTAVDLDLDGERHGFTENQSVERPLGDLREIVIPGMVRVLVRPGSGGRDLADTVRQAQDEYTALCERAGVRDIPQARTAMERRRAAEQRVRTCEQMLERELGGQRIEQLRADHVRLTASTGQYLRDRSAGTALPADLELARATAAQASQHVAGLRARLALADEKAEHLVATLNERALAVRLADHRISDTEGHVAELTERLAGARQKERDEDLDTRFGQAAANADTASEQWRSAAETLAADDPGSVRALLDNEQAVGVRLAEDILRTGTDRARIEALLGRGQGAQEAYDEARRLADAADQHRANLQRRAEAARLLYDTLTRHRENARRAYVSPFREQILRLGRIVFGEGLDVDVDDSLRITSRTLGGVTVGFEQLSSGAKEQLCLCARLACAELVDPADGVPVVIDDALGYTDAGRLTRLGAVLNSSATHSQIIVLTCMPERYRSIGHAETVSLRPSVAPVRPGVPHQSDDGEQEQDRPSGRLAADPVDRSRSSEVDVILACLRDADDALGRSEILARTGVDSEGWPHAIRDLLDSGKVTRSGARRGTRYRAT